MTPWTVACQVPLSMGFPRQEYWSGFPFPPPGDPPNAGIEPRSPTLQEDDAGRDWGQEKKGTTEDEMAGWHHRLDGLSSCAPAAFPGNHFGSKFLPPPSTTESGYH